MKPSWSRRRHPVSNQASSTCKSTATNSSSKHPRNRNQGQGRQGQGGPPQQECYQSVKLPLGIDPEKVDATYRDGILTVTLLKAAEATKKDPRQECVISSRADSANWDCSSYTSRGQDWRIVKSLFWRDEWCRAVRQ